MTGEHERIDELREPMFNGLGDGADMEAGRRAALVERIVAAQAGAARAGAKRPRRRALFLSAGALAAAAVVLAAIVFWPQQRPPIPPTEIFTYLLGPLTEMTATTGGGSAVQEDGSAAEAVFGAVWSDLEVPLAIGMDALEAPQALVSVEPAGHSASVNHPSVRKEK